MSFTVIRPSSALLAFACVGAALLPASVRAQATDVASVAVSAPVSAVTSAPSSPRSIAVPHVAVSGIDTRASIDASDALVPALQDRGMRAGPNIALMGVGVAAVVLGLLVGGDGGAVIAVSGGALGLLGLYRFMR
jgi:hypothetical protein